MIIIPIILWTDHPTINHQKLPGVYGCYTKADIPGENLVLSPEILMIAQSEELFVADRVLYHGQPCGVIAASNFNLAQKAAKLVRITYERPQHNNTMILPDVRAVVESLGQNRIQAGIAVDPGNNKSPLANNSDSEKLKMNKNKFEGQHEIKGEFNTAGQYHYTMEPQTTVSVVNANRLID